jgi:hypothetical protein
VIALDEIPSFIFTEASTIRLISMAYIDEPAMVPLVDSEDELSVLERLEGMTSARHRSKPPIPRGVTDAELVNESHGYGWTYINAAFCYTRTTGNRFNGPERGAWYACYGENAAQAAQQEVAFHLTRELEATGIYENETAYCELLAGFTAVFHDLNGFENEAFLNPDPSVGYPAGQELSRRILEAGGRGVLYPSVRCSGGACLAAFRPSIVQNIRPGETWLFQWSGGRIPRITRKPQ